MCQVKVVNQYATFTLSAVGDVIMGGDPAVTSALNRSTRDTFAQLLSTYGTSYPFKNVQQVFHADDLTIANLECALTTRTSYKDKTHTWWAIPPMPTSSSRRGSMCATWPTTTPRT